MSTQIFWSDDHQLQEWQEEILKREFNDKRGTNSNSGPGGDRSSFRSLSCESNKRWEMKLAGSIPLGSASKILF